MGRRSGSDSGDSRSHSSSKKQKKRKKNRRSSSSSDSDSDDQRRRYASRKQRRSRSRSSDDSYRGVSRSKHSSSSSRSRKKGKSPSSSRSSGKSSKHHVDAVMGLSTGTLKDVMDIVPGFSKMTPAEQNRVRVRRALKAAAEAQDAWKDEVLNEGKQNQATDDVVDVVGQIRRTKEIEKIADSDDDGDDEFIPSHFRSDRKQKQKAAVAAGKRDHMTRTEREGTHELAIFGHGSMISVDEALKRKKLADDRALDTAKSRVDFMERDPRTLAADQLMVSTEEADQRWIAKLKQIRDKLFDPTRHLQAA